VDLASPDGNAFLFVTAGPATSNSVTADLRSDITNNASNPNYSNAQLQGGPTTTGASGNFDQVATVTYTATGTEQFDNGAPVYGLYLEALNSDTQNSVFGDFHSPT
jgi:hypothetical protein